MIVDVAHSNVDRIFEYILPESIPAQPGCRVRVPFGNMRTEGFVIALKDSAGCDPKKLKRVEEGIDEKPILTEEQLVLAKYVCHEYRTTLCFALRLMFPAQMRGQRVHARRTRMIALAEGVDVQAELAACYTKTGVLRAKNRFKTLEALRAADQPSAVLDGPSVRMLLSRGVAREYYRDDFRAPYSALPAENPLTCALTPAQQNAVRRVGLSVDAGKRHTILLHGVTGSGKTLVYVHAVRHALAQGKTAIVLVPEISLTPQLFSIFSGEFGNNVAVFHSGLSPGERYDEWRRVANGSAKIVLGARSAVFMPLQNLGLIIIDEEHEQSYKADNHPPYHAADIARMRCHLNGATLVLASATPRIESYFRAKMGIYELVELPERVRGLALPAMQVVDMRGEFLRGNKTSVSGALYRALERVLARGEQALLFLNRRGWAGSVQCPSCGHVRMCTHCDVPLKYHSGQDALVCHYCGRSFPFTRVCPECGDPFVRLVGVGTEQLEHQVQKLFPHASLLRMDFDTTRKKDAHQQIYERFKNGEADILIGTQMIARGLDFDRVSLAAIVAADTLLSFGDYRAEERCFSMIEQVAGRAGRRQNGRVIVQTFNPDHYAVRFAARHDYQGMFLRELEARRQACKPPFARVYRLVFTHRDRARAEDACLRMQKLMEGMLFPIKSDILLFVAKAAPVEMLDGRARFHILLKVNSNAQTRHLKQKIFQLMDGFDTKGATMAFDVDPYDVN